MWSNICKSTLTVTIFSLNFYVEVYFHIKFDKYTDITLLTLKHRDKKILYTLSVQCQYAYIVYSEKCTKTNSY